MKRYYAIYRTVRLNGEEVRLFLKTFSTKTEFKQWRRGEGNQIELIRFEGICGLDHLELAKGEDSKL